MLPAIVNPITPENAAKAFRLRAQGQSDSYIATDLDCDPSIVPRLVRFHVKHTARVDSPRERRAQRAIELARLEEAYAKLREPALNGDTRAMKSMLEVLSAKRALLGLNAPTEVHQVNTDANAFVSFVRGLRAAKQTQPVLEVQTPQHLDGPSVPLPYVP